MSARICREILSGHGVLMISVGRFERHSRFAVHSGRGCILKINNQKVWI